MDDTPLRYIPEPDHVFTPVPEPPPEPPKTEAKSPRVSRMVLFLSIGAGLFLLSLFIHLHVAPPVDFPEDTVITVDRGQTLAEEGKVLKEQKIIKSPTVFRFFMALFGGRRSLMAGDYYLSKSQNVVALSWRLSHSLYDLKNIRITIPEGLNSKEIADIFGKEERFTRFDSQEFVRLASQYEGYLFPDTYLFLPNITAQGVIDAMILNYQKRIETLAGEIRTFGRPIKDVISMASIIEEEARTEETRKIIAGILWKRLGEGMPLQVDSAFAFVNGKKDSRDLTSEDLKIDSPYNTYVKVGLPPTPISNPGLNAVRTVINPIETKYYFYLSDDDGNMHYAVGLDGHIANKAKYLNY